MPATTPPTAPAGIAHASPPHAHAHATDRAASSAGFDEKQPAGSQTPPACTHCASGAAASTATGQASRGIQRRTTPLWGSGSLRSVCSRTMRALPSAPSGSMMSWAARIPHTPVSAPQTPSWAASPHSSSVVHRFTHSITSPLPSVTWSAPSGPDAKPSRSNASTKTRRLPAGSAQLQSASGGTAPSDCIASDPAGAANGRFCVRHSDAAQSIPNLPSAQSASVLLGSQFSWATVKPPRRPIASLVKWSVAAPPVAGTVTTVVPVPVSRA